MSDINTSLPLYNDVVFILFICAYNGSCVLRVILGGFVEVSDDT